MVIGSTNGQVWVPFQLDDGSTDWSGAVVQCDDCGKVWFANFSDPQASTCPACLNPSGGHTSLSAARAANKAGVEVGWIGSHDPVAYRAVIRDGVTQRRSEQ